MTTSSSFTRRAAVSVIAALAGLILEMEMHPAAAADPTVHECLEANETSINQRKAHKLKEARAQLLVCAAASCPAEVREECGRRLTEVNSTIPTLILVITKAGGVEVVDATVTMDGQPFATRLDGMAVEVDPGEHMFTFKVPGLPEENRRLVLREGEKNRREDVLIGPRDAATTPPGAKPPAGPTTPTSPTTPPSSDAKSDGVSLRTVGLITAGVGLGATAVGAVFGVMAMSQRNDAKCPENVCEDQDGATKLRDAISTASVATGFFIAGGVLMAGGLGMFLFAPAPAASSASSPSRTATTTTTTTKPSVASGLGVKLANGGGGLSYSGWWW